MLPHQEPPNLTAQMSVTEEDSVPSAPDLRDSPNLPLEPITSSSKKTRLSTGTVTTTMPGTVLLKVPATKSQLNTSPSTENTTPRRPSKTPKPPRSENLVKPPTASEERAPNISTRSLDSNFQSHFQAEISAIAMLRTITHATDTEISNSPVPADIDYF